MIGKLQANCRQIAGKLQANYRIVDMASSPKNREEPGRLALSSRSFFMSGLFQGFRNIGTRIKAAHYKPVMEAFCACAGRIAAENGRLKQAEVTGFRQFILEHHTHPVIGNFSVDELVEKFKEYAIKAFLEDEEPFITVLDLIVPGSEAAQMIVTGCLAVAFADGECDRGERIQLENLAVRLGVKIEELTKDLGVDLPPPASRSSRLGMALQQPVTAKQPATAQPATAQQPVTAQPATAKQPATAQQPVTAQPATVQPATVQQQPVSSGDEQQKCTFCQGKGCVFCKNTGFK